MRAVSGLTRRPGSEPETVVGMVSRFCNCSEVVLVEMLGRRRVRRAQRSMMTRRTSTTATTPSCRPNPVDVQADVSLTGTLSAMEPYPLVSKVDLSRIRTSYLRSGCPGHRPRKALTRVRIVKVNINARAWSEMIGWRIIILFRMGWGPRMKVLTLTGVARRRERCWPSDARSSSVRPPRAPA